MSLPFVGREDLARILPIHAAVDALDAAFKRPLPTAPPRTHLALETGELLLMPSWGEQGAGVKLVTVNPSNPPRGLPLVSALYVLFSADSLEPEAIVDGAALTALRTAAVSGLATRYLARPDATRLVIFGAGTQARSHLDSMVVVRPITTVVVVSRTAAAADRLSRHAAQKGLSAEVGEAASVADADIVCTCTTSSDPVFDGSLLAEGAHVNAIGAYRPQTRELDDVTVRRALVVVETREAAISEAGDLVIPLSRGVIGPSHVVADLSEVARGVRVRRRPGEVTVFKSVGVAFEDLVVARAVLDRLAA